MARTIGIIGASGWLGRHLSNALLGKGYRVVGFSRSEKRRQEMDWRTWSGEGEVDLSGIDVVINLAGESIDQRWTEAKKKQFHESRIGVTEEIVRGMKKCGVPRLLNASAVGIYGDQGERSLSEMVEPGNNYLAGLCLAWEKAANGAPESTFLRTGVVLGKDGGAWQKMRKVFKLGIGGNLGSGKQWMPWIHLEDEVAAIAFCLEEEITGPVNLVAPESVTNSEFTKMAGSALSRPTFFTAPAFALKAALGDFAEEGLLASQRVIPKILQDRGFEFRFPDLRSALKDLA